MRTKKDYTCGNKKSINFRVKENGEFKMNNIDSTCQMYETQLKQYVDGNL